MVESMKRNIQLVEGLSLYVNRCLITLQNYMRRAFYLIVFIFEHTHLTKGINSKEYCYYLSANRSIGMYSSNT